MEEKKLLILLVDFQKHNNITQTNIFLSMKMVPAISIQMTSSDFPN